MDVFAPSAYLTTVFHLIPEIVLACSAMLLLLIGAVCKHYKEQLLFRLTTVFAVLVLVGLVAYLLVAKPHDAVLFNIMWQQDLYSRLIKTILAAGMVLILLLSYSYGKANKLMKYEWVVIALLSLLGMFIMASSTHLLIFYLGLELQSLSLYVLAALNRNAERSSEAAIKYFMLGALASGLFLFGMSYVYGFTGELGFYGIANYVVANDVLGNVGFVLGTILMLTGFFFKLSLVPFHMWAPDVYEGAPKPVVALIASLPKLALVAVLGRFLFLSLIHIAPIWQQILILVGVVSIIFGALAAIKQTNIKRLLAYSSISHMGFVILGLGSASAAGLESSLFYTVLYIFMSIGTFAMLQMMRRSDTDVSDVIDLSGLASQRPVLAAGMSILMLSMAGIPPMAGFWGKFYVFAALLEADFVMAAVVAVLGSVVGAFYYLRIIKVMYFDSLEQMYGDISLAAEPLERKSSRWVMWVFALCVLFNLFFTLAPSWLINPIELAVQGIVR